MKKRILSMILTIVMVVTMMPVTAMATQVNSMEHVHDSGIGEGQYTALTADTTCVTENSYLYLADNVVLNSTLTVSGGDVCLCLNGHTLSLKSGEDGSVIKVENSAILRLCNCSTADGIITGGNAVNGGGICNEGLLRIEIGNVGKIVITGNHASELGGGIYNGFNMVVLSPFQVTGNTAGVNGGGLYYRYNPVAAFSDIPIMKDIWIINNSVNSKANNACLENGRCFYFSSIYNISEANSQIGITPAVAPTIQEPLDVFRQTESCQGECVWKNVFFADDPTLYSVKVEPFANYSNDGVYKLYLERTPVAGDVLYPVQFNTNGGGSVGQSAPYLAGSTLPLKESYKSGATFVGWKCSVDGQIYTGTYTIPEEFNDPNGITFTAQWGYGISYRTYNGLSSSLFAMTDKSGYIDGETVVVKPREGYVLNEVRYSVDGGTYFTDVATPQNDGTHTFEMPRKDVIIWVSSKSEVTTGTHSHDCDHDYCDGTWENATLLNDSGQLNPTLTSDSTSYFVLRKNFDPGFDSSIFEPRISSGTATVHLCLNGKRINRIVVPSGVTMYICDCAETKGTISTLTNNGTVYIGAGSYKNVELNNGEINVYGQMKLIEYLATRDQTFKMMNADARIHFSGTPAAINMKVSPYTEGVFATGWENSYSDFGKRVKSADPKYSITRIGSDLSAVKNPTYSVTYADSDGVTVGGKYQVADNEAVAGGNVNITITPDSGFEVDTVSYTPIDGTAITVQPVNGAYRFTMLAKNVIVKVTFKQVSVTGVTLNKTSTTIVVGETETLIATVAPLNAFNKTVTWSSDDENVATVINGVVTAVGAGTTSVTVTTADGGFSDTCDVTVEEYEIKVQPTVDNDYTVTANGSPSYQWYKVEDYTAAGALVTEEFLENGNGIVKGTYNPETEKWSPIQDIMYGYFMIYMNTGEELTLTFDEEPSSVPFLVGCNLGSRTFGVSQGGISGGNIYTYTAPLGSGGTSVRDIYALIFPSTPDVPTMSAIFKGSALEKLSGQTEAKLNTSNLESGAYVCKVIWAEPAYDNYAGIYELSQSVQYTAPTYEITATVSPAAVGTVSGTGSYTSGTAVTLTATPKTGYKFVNWTKDSVEVSTSASIEITVTGDAAYVANFQRNSQGSTGGKRPSSNKGNNTEVVPPVVEEEKVACAGDDKCLMHGYSDLDPKVWYHDGIEYCIEKGIMSGYGNGVFKPNADTSRAMLMVMLWNMNGSPIVSDSMDFKDVAEGKWYTEAIRWAKAEGIASGYGNGYFGTDDLITREQVVTMLWNYAKYKGMDVSKAEETSILSYGDAEDVARYAVSAMQWACGSGVVSGKNNADKTGLILDPAGNGTRAQIATMIWNFCEKQ